MSTLTALLEEALTKAKPPLQKWLDGLDAEDRANLEAVRYDKAAIPTTRLHAIMKSAGCPVGEKTITAWREADNG
jgi:hypothetical protein